MSKDCNSCEYCSGWDWSDGTPQCSYEDESSGDRGYEYCPYNDQSTIRNNGMKIEIDSKFMSEYIRHTIQNTVESKADQIARAEVQSIIDDQMKEEIRKKVSANVDSKIDSVIDQAFNNFLDESILVGGGFLEASESMTRRQYIAKQVERKLSGMDVGKIRSAAESEAVIQVDKFTKGLQKEINQSIKTYFDEATRQTLTENVVSMLMCSDTYRKLSDGMGRLLPENKQ